jgi:hypothetical protein
MGEFGASRWNNLGEAVEELVSEDKIQSVQNVVFIVYRCCRR